jgi:CRISPR-associated protein Cas2
MWILVMFDLPVGTKEQMRAATKFREYLLDEGFEMSQFSIYARFCNGKEQYEAHVRRIESNLPEKGDIHILGFTDKQYENIIRFSGQGRKRQRKNPGQLALF